MRSEGCEKRAVCSAHPHRPLRDSIEAFRATFRLPVRGDARLPRITQHQWSDGERPLREREDAEQVGDGQREGSSVNANVPPTTSVTWSIPSVRHGNVPADADGTAEPIDGETNLVHAVPGVDESRLRATACVPPTWDEPAYTERLKQSADHARRAFDRYE